MIRKVWEVDPLALIKVGRHTIPSRPEYFEAYSSNRYFMPSLNMSQRYTGYISTMLARRFIRASRAGSVPAERGLVGCFSNSRTPELWPVAVYDSLRVLSLFIIRKPEISQENHGRTAFTFSVSVHALAGTRFRTPTLCARRTTSIILPIASRYAS
jgi:hypothetical protein